MLSHLTMYKAIAHRVSSQALEDNQSWALDSISVLHYLTRYYELVWTENPPHPSSQPSGSLLGTPDRGMNTSLVRGTSRLK